MTTRSCGSCQACCEALGVWPDGDRAKPPLTAPGEKCFHQIEGGQCDSGCAIYPNHPEPCKIFKCWWLLGWGRKKDRPDKLGIVFEQLEDQEGKVRMLCASEAWSCARAERKAARVLDRLKEKIPFVVVIPFGRGAEEAELWGA